MCAWVAVAQVQMNFDYYGSALVWNMTDYAMWMNSTRLRFQITGPTNETSVSSAPGALWLGALFMMSVEWQSSTRTWQPMPLPTRDRFDNGNGMLVAQGLDSVFRMTRALRLLQRSLGTTPVPDTLQHLCPTLTPWQLTLESNVWLLGTARNHSRYFDYFLGYLSPFHPGNCNSTLPQRLDGLVAALSASSVLRVYPWTRHVSNEATPAAGIVHLTASNQTVQAFTAFVEIAPFDSEAGAWTPAPAPAWDLQQTHIEPCTMQPGQVRPVLVFQSPQPALDVTTITGVTVLCDPGQRQCRMLSAECMDIEAAFAQAQAARRAAVAAGTLNATALSAPISLLTLNARIQDTTGRVLYAYVVFTTETDRGTRDDHEMLLPEWIIQFMGSVSMPLALGFLSLVLIFLMVMRYSVEMACRKRAEQQRRRQQILRSTPSDLDDL